MRIRSAQRKDIAAVVTLDAVGAADRVRKERIRHAIRERAVYVADGLGDVLGYAIVSRSFFGRYFVEKIVVRTRDRRRGVGEHLMAHAEGISSAAGELWTSTNQSNKAMRRLLRKRGFRIAGRVNGLDVGDPEVFYVKKAEQVARANAHSRHASCCGKRIEMKASNLNSSEARVAPAAGVAHL